MVWEHKLLILRSTFFVHKQVITFVLPVCQEKSNYVHIIIWSTTLKTILELFLIAMKIQ